MIERGEVRTKSGVGVASQKWGRRHVVGSGNGDYQQ